ncbi:PilZ domain-containing protein [Leptospira ognonensis]|uniref:PilZ domain-containing protein n=1 Tax=Leptospira ognonensis TaxID=2484945 RepID=A0A4R9K4M1_9LEPT|nr:PilZ domain-containing protein [Leptospira ognonensis]TGL60114.1 PilZ domain-containing protein [Leptospira ognonensis]
MDSERRLPRISPREFRGFEVQLDLDGLTIMGKLGNISEEGLCFVGDDDFLSDEIDNLILGTILFDQGSQRIFFEGKVMWVQTAKIRGVACYLAGLQFTEKMKLTDSMLARVLEI